VLVFWWLLALIPGASAIAHGRLIGGATLCLVGFSGWNLALYSLLLPAAGGSLGLNATSARWLGLSIASVATVCSLVWTHRITSPSRRERLDRSTAAALQSAQLAYLRGDLSSARQSVREGLRADSRDVDLLFLAWQFARDFGDTSEERTMKRRLLRLDLDEKWAWQLQRVRVLEASSRTASEANQLEVPGSPSEEPPVNATDLPSPTGGTSEVESVPSAEDREADVSSEDSKREEAVGDRG